MKHNRFVWWRVVQVLLLLFFASVAVPLSTWWYLPIILWLVLRAFTHISQGFWILFFVLLLSLQLAILWAWPIGIIIILMSVIIWLYERISASRHTAIRWTAEALHGSIVCGVFLILMQAFTVERFLWNMLGVFIFVMIRGGLGQWYGREE